MKFTIVAALLIASVSASPVKKGVNPSLVPPFGHKAGLNPTRMSHTIDYIFFMLNINKNRYRWKL